MRYFLLDNLSRITNDKNIKRYEENISRNPETHVPFEPISMPKQDIKTKMKIFKNVEMFVESIQTPFARIPMNRFQSWPTSKGSLAKCL